MITSQVRSFLRRLNGDIRARNIGLSVCRLSDDSDHNENDKKSKAKEKLNALLQSIIKDDSLEKVSPKEVNVKPTFMKQRVKLEKPKTLGQKLTDAAKEVATSIEGDPKKTEAELLHRVLYKNEKLQKSVLKASGNDILSELLSTMNVELEKSDVPATKDSYLSRADQVRRVVSSRSRRPLKAFDSSFDLFREPPLNWFNVKKVNVSPPVLPTWEKCHLRELRLKITHPPSNYWEQMILWTDRGMLWKFPIDNEQGLDDEKKVPFTDHVFLEKHLENWCPIKGPIRHFMEVVCVGLSRNHWMTADEKKAHIHWYRDFFRDKKALIAELGAGVIGDGCENQETKQIS